MNWSEQVVLVTRGTGSFGKKFVELILAEYRPQKLIIFSRDELKQHDMRCSGFDHPSLRYFIGDVRDARCLQRAFAGVSIVVHAAALKQVPACEYNPFEAIQTNIMGGKDAIDAAIDQGVQRILALSTDKAVNPVNLYGATKLCAEKYSCRRTLIRKAKHTVQLRALWKCFWHPGKCDPNVFGATEVGEAYDHGSQHDAFLDYPRTRGQIRCTLH